MWLRRIGWTLLALAVVLGTPVAVTFVPSVSLSFPPGREYGPEKYVGQTRYIDRGALVHRRTVSDHPWFPWPASRPGSPMALWWTVKGENLDANIPVWPVPPVVALLGCVLLGVGYARSARRTARPSMRRRFIGTSLCVALATTGLATASLVAVSWWCPDGAEYYDVTLHRSGDDNAPPRVDVLDLRVENGGFGVWQSLDWDLNGRPWFQRPAPGWFVARWHSDANGWSFCIPVWPVPVFLLGAAAWVGWRNHRAFVRARKECCPACGYSLAGLNTGVCPECGVQVAERE